MPFGLFDEAFEGCVSVYEVAAYAAGADFALAVDLGYAVYVVAVFGLLEIYPVVYVAEPPVEEGGECVCYGFVGGLLKPALTTFSAVA